MFHYDASWGKNNGHRKQLSIPWQILTTYILLLFLFVLKQYSSTGIIIYLYV